MLSWYRAIDHITKGFLIMVFGHYFVILWWMVFIKPYDSLSATAIVMPIVLNLAQISGATLGIWIMVRPLILPQLRKLWPGL